MSFIYLDYNATTPTDPRVAEQVEIQSRYAGYIDRQRDDIERQRRHESFRLPDDLDYARVRGLSSEVREKFTRHRPATLGQAARLWNEGWRTDSRCWA